MTNIAPSPDLAAAQFTARWEGSACWIYLDSCGYPTTGVGHLLKTVDAALALPWRRMVDGIVTDQRATGDEIRAVYALIASHGTPGHPQAFRAEHFAPMTTIRLLDADVTSLLAHDLGRFADSLGRYMPGFARWPHPAQIAALDWTFQAGVGGLLHTTTLGPALARGDFRTAAGACHRAASSKERNAATRDLLLQAAGVPR